MKYQKTFKTETKTSKGTFPIEITVWKESMGDYSSATRWKFKGFVMVEGKKFPLSAYWKTIGTSHKMMKHFGVNYDTQFKADFSEVISYTQGIDREEDRKTLEMKKNYNNMMRDIAL